MAKGPQLRAHSLLTTGLSALDGRNQSGLRLIIRPFRLLPLKGPVDDRMGHPACYPGRMSLLERTNLL